MKVYQKRFVIQTNNAPIKFYVGKGNDYTDEIDKAILYEDRSKAEEDIKGEMECHVADCMLTFEF